MSNHQNALREITLASVSPDMLAMMAVLRDMPASQLGVHVIGRPEITGARLQAGIRHLFGRVGQASIAAVAAAAPAPVVAVKAKRARVVKGDGLQPGEAFVRGLRAARLAMVADVGERWHVVPGASTWCHLPTRLASYKTERGTRISNPRDMRIPAARYWPGGVHPAGVELPTGERPDAMVAFSEALEARRARERQAAEPIPVEAVADVPDSRVEASSDPEEDLRVLEAELGRMEEDLAAEAAAELEREHAEHRRIWEERRAARDAERARNA